MIQIIFWASIALYIFAAIYVTRKIENSDSFFVMNNKGNTLFITGTLLASMMSSTTFIGISGIVYENGPPILLIVFTSWMGTALAAIYTGRYLRAANCRTMPDYLEFRFGPVVRITGTIIMLIGLIAYGIVQLMGAGVVLSAITGLSYEIMIILFVVVLILFGTLGGMWAVIVTDTIMCFTFIIATLVISPIGISKAGGLESITQVLFNENPLYWSAGGAVLDQPIGWSIGQMILWILFFTAAPWLATRTLSAKNDFVVMKAAIWTILLSTIMVTILYLAVFSVRAINPSINPADQVFVWMSENLVNPVLGGIGIAGVMAAILSTASTIFIYAGFALSRDLYERLSTRELTDKQKIMAARLGQVVIGIIMLVIGLMQPVSIYWVGAWAGALFAVSWLPTLIAGFHWKNASKYGVITSMIGGTITYVLIYQLIYEWGVITLPFGLDPIIPGVAISFILMIVVSHLFKADLGTIERFTNMTKEKLNQATIRQYSNNQSVLIKGYKSTRNLAIISIIVAMLFFGYLIIEIALKV